jgi:hypothetical protein
MMATEFMVSATLCIKGVLEMLALRCDFQSHTDVCGTRRCAGCVVQ